MIVFVAVAAVMTLFALAVLLPALWRSNDEDVVDHEAVNVDLARTQLSRLTDMHAAGEIDDNELQQQREDLERALAASLSVSTVQGNSATTSSRGIFTALLVAIVLPCSAAALYWKLGTPQALDPAFLASADKPDTSQLASVEELLPKLEAHLQQQPDDLQGWRLLGVTYLRMQRFSDADTALGNALALAPDDPEILLQLADTKAMLAGGKLAGAPEALVNRALDLSPGNAQGLWMLGMSHEQQGRSTEAITTFEKLLVAVGDDPKAVSEIEQLINNVRASSDNESAATATAATQSKAQVPDSSPDSGAKIEISVTLGEQLQGQLDPGLSVFVYAKAVSGPPMPLAVAKREVSDLPLTLTLDDSMAMVAGMSLSSSQSVIVGARVSLSGQPVAGAGDYYAEVDSVAVGSNELVELVISRVVP